MWNFTQLLFSWRDPAALVDNSVKLYISFFHLSVFLLRGFEYSNPQSEDGKEIDDDNYSSSSSKFLDRKQACDCCFLDSQLISEQEVDAVQSVEKTNGLSTQSHLQFIGSHFHHRSNLRECFKWVR